MSLSHKTQKFLPKIQETIDGEGWLIHILSLLEQHLRRSKWIFSYLGETLNSHFLFLGVSTGIGFTCSTLQCVKCELIPRKCIFVCVCVRVCVWWERYKWYSAEDVKIKKLTPFFDICWQLFSCPWKAGALSPPVLMGGSNHLSYFPCMATPTLAPPTNCHKNYKLISFLRSLSHFLISMWVTLPSSGCFISVTLSVLTGQPDVGWGAILFTIVGKNTPFFFSFFFCLKKLCNDTSIHTGVLTLRLLLLTDA